MYGPLIMRTPESTEPLLFNQFVNTGSEIPWFELFQASIEMIDSPPLVKVVVLFEDNSYVSRFIKYLRDTGQEKKFIVASAAGFAEFNVSIFQITCNTEQRRTVSSMTGLQYRD